MSTFQEDKIAGEELKHRADQAEIFYNWLVSHQEYNYTAAINLIKSYYNSSDWSSANLTESANILVEKGIISPLSSDRVQSDAAKAKKEAEEAEAQERIDLTNFICKAMVMQPETEKSERQRFLSQKATDITTLRQIKQNILAKRELQAKSVEELKNIARGEAPSQWKPVPHIYQNRSMLISLANTNFDEFKLLTKKCGKHQIDAILNKPEKE